MIIRDDQKSANSRSWRFMRLSQPAVAQSEILIHKNAHEKTRKMLLFEDQKSH